MIKNSNRRGLALTSILALVVSLFGGVLPARAADALTLQPLDGSAVATMQGEAFYLQVFGTGAGRTDIDLLTFKVVASSTTSAAFENTSSAGYDVSWSGYAKATFTSSGDVSYLSPTAAGATNSLTTSATSSAGYKNVLALKTLGVTSSTATGTATVTAFLDYDGNGKLSAGDLASDAVKITWYKWSAAPAKVAMAAISEREVAFTASVTVGTLNTYSMRAGTGFEVHFQTEHTFSASVNAMSGLSASSVSGLALTAKSSIVATLVYNDGTERVSLSSVSSKVGAATIDDITSSAVADADNLRAGADLANSFVRLNKAASVKFVASKSGAVKGAKLNITVSASALSEDKYVVVNGVTYTDSDALPTTSDTALSLTTNAKGEVQVNVTTVGFADGQAVEVFASAQTKTAKHTFTYLEPNYSVYPANAQLAKPGSTVPVSFTVEDQWSVSPTTANDYRIELSFAGGDFDMDKSYLDVVGQVAAGNIKLAGSTASGTLTVTPNMQVWSVAGNRWINEAAATTESALSVVVSTADVAISFAPTASVSGSISYDAWSYSSDVTFSTNLGGGVAVVSADDVVFLVAGVSYSDTANVITDANGRATFSMASKMSGTHTISITVGDTTSTFSFIVDAASSDAGTGIVVSTNLIPAAATTPVVVTLVDDNGNPVQTSASGDIKVSWTGTKVGVPVGALPSETDAAGQFTLNVFTAAGDDGTATLTVTYYKDGKGNTAAKDIQTFTAAVRVGEPVVEEEPVSDVVVTVGTFTGYTAVFVKGAEGSKLSVKLAGKWHVVPSIVDGAAGYYLWKQKTGAGYVANVSVYIDGELVKTEVITTK
jgi:hypothetical protein